MPACWKRWCLGAVTVLMLLGGGLGAAAAPATTPSAPPTLLHGIARNLGVPAAKLEAAVRAAELERWNAFASAHHIPEARAKAIGERIRNEPLTLAVRFGGGAKRGLLTAAAGYLGLPREQLAQQLRQGKTLAELATAHGKTADGLKAAILASAEQDLNGRVQLGELTPAARDRMLNHLTQHIDEILQTRFRTGAGSPTSGVRPLRAG